jgi:hypothetical protein
MTFAPEEGGAPPPPAEEEGGGPELHTDDLDQPAPAAPAPAPAPRQEQPAGLAGDMGLAIGSDGIDWDRANRIRSMGGRWVRIDLNWQSAGGGAGRAPLGAVRRHDRRIA